MDLKEFKDKINKLFSPELKIELKKAIEETKLADEGGDEGAAKTTDEGGQVMNEAKLKDGTVIKFVGNLAAGTKLLVVTDEGELPAPEGEHELETGEILVVVKEGEDSVIQEIKAPAATDETKMRADIKAELSKELQYYKKEADAKLKVMSEQLDAVKLKLSKTTASVHTVALAVNKIGEIPTDDSTEKPANKDVVLSKKEKLLINLNKK